MARLGEITVKLDHEQLAELRACYEEKIKALRLALRVSIFVLEKANKVLFEDQLPARKPTISDAIRMAENTLKETK